MADRRTRVTLSIPWDDETQDHPSQWGYQVLLDVVEEVHVVGFDDMEERDEDWEVESDVTVAKPVGAIVSARLPKEIAEMVFQEAGRQGVPASTVLRAIITAHFITGTAT